MSNINQSWWENENNQLLKNQTNYRNTSQININYYIKQRIQQRIIRNKGYLNETKKSKNTRILILNLNRLRCSDSNKIQMIIEKLKEMQIDSYLLTETNIKWIMSNKMKMLRKMKALRQNIETICEDSIQSYNIRLVTRRNLK